MSAKKNTVSDESPPPPALGKALDELAKIHKKLDKAEAAAAAVKKVYDEAKQALLLEYNKAGATSVKSKLATGYISVSDIISVTDWPAFEAYVYKHKAFELFQRRAAVRATIDRLEAGEKVPVVKDTRRTLNIKLN